jgi:aminoglycoside N3'-acetyltransferase
MFGVSFHYYTFFHTAEFEAGSEYAYQHGVIDWLRVLDETGAVRERASRRQNWAPMRFAEAGELMERNGLVRRLPLGREFLRFVPDAAKAHDFLIERLRKTPDFLRQSCPVELY